MSSDSLVILNSLNWAIIASSALGGFCQFVENRHRDKFQELKTQSLNLERLVIEYPNKSSPGETKWIEQVSNDISGLTRVNLRIPIVGLFGLVFAIAVFNLIGIWLVWFEDSQLSNAIKVFANIRDPMYSYNLPLGFVAWSLVILCIIMFFQLCKVRKYQNKFAELKVQVDREINRIDRLIIHDRSRGRLELSN